MPELPTNGEQRHPYTHHPPRVVRRLQAASGGARLRADFEHSLLHISGTQAQCDAAEELANALFTRSAVRARVHYRQLLALMHCFAQLQARQCPL